MRTRTFFGLVLLTTACSAAPRVSVYRLGVGDNSSGLQGDPVRQRPPPEEKESYVGVKRGYHVVRGQDDWQSAWGETKVPAFPAGFDTSTTMMLLGVPESRDAVDVAITKVVESGGFLHVWVRETMRGEGCLANKADRLPHAAVLVPRIEKATKFYVEEKRAEACGEAPKAEVRCRRNGENRWAGEIEAEPGDLVECEMTAESRGRFALVDRLLSLTEVPIGSTAKLAFPQGSMRAALRVDLFGTYAVRGEATDENNRKGFADVLVRATPPKSKDARVLLVWGNVERGDDPDTFPRVTLTARRDGQECALDKQPPELCEMKRFGANTFLTLKGPSTARMPLEVRYIDEHPEKGPAACLQIWLDGARTEELCDRVRREPEARWSPGAIDMATGKLVELPPPAPVADAGAPPAPSKKKSLR